MIFPSFSYEFHGPLRFLPSKIPKPGHDPKGRSSHDEEGAQSGDGLTAFAAALLVKSPGKWRNFGWENHQKNINGKS